MSNKIEYGWFNNEELLLNLIKGRDDLELFNRGDMFSIKHKSNNADRDTNTIDIYNEYSDIYLSNYGDSIPLDNSLIFKFYNSLKFHFLYLDEVLSLFNMVSTVAQQYKVYKPYDVIGHYKLLDDALNYKKRKIQTSVFIEINYDVSALLASGKGKNSLDEIIIEKLYKINNDGSLSESMTFLFPARMGYKIQFRIINVLGEHKLYYAINRNDHFKYIDKNDFKELVTQVFFKRYQAAVEKHLNIKNADYDERYISLLEMIKI